MNGYSRTALFVVLAGGLTSFAIFRPGAREDVRTDWIVVSSEAGEGRHEVRIRTRGGEESLEVRLHEAQERQEEALKRSREIRERAREARERAFEEAERAREEAERAMERTRGPFQIGSDGAPLIYVDGVRVAEGFDLETIAPERVERIEVLKAEAAEARYGEEARNGVVQIFLKPN